MANLNIKSKKENSYDAIVIGSGISGGWAAKEFCEKGLNTLVLERGREVKHIKDYPTTNSMPWELEHRGGILQSVKEENPVVSRCYAYVGAISILKDLPEMDLLLTGPSATKTWRLGTAM